MPYISSIHSARDPVSSLLCHSEPASHESLSVDKPKLPAGRIDLDRQRFPKPKSPLDN